MEFQEFLDSNQLLAITYMIIQPLKLLYSSGASKNKIDHLYILNIVVHGALRDVMGNEYN